jgi:hypothetical protein
VIAAPLVPGLPEISGAASAPGPGDGPGTGPGTDVLVAWAEQSRRAAEPGHGRLRFAFYGRVSTEDWQDPVTSRARQRELAAALVAGHGAVVAEFFDAGESRTLAWARRPQAAALVAALADPDRGWDAIVIGEYERAFYGGQYASMAPLFAHYGVKLWLPEAGGPVGNGEDHEQLMLALGFAVQAGGHPDPDPGPDRDGHPDQGAGPLPGRPPAVRIPAGGRRAAPEQRPTPPGAAGRTGSSRTPRPRRSWRGCSRSGFPGAAPRGSPAP